MQFYFIPSRVAVEGIKSVPSVCVCVSVNALTAEPFDIQTRNLVEALTLIISRMSSKVKVKGQGRQVEKRDFRSFRWVNFTEPVGHDT